MTSLVEYIPCSAVTSPANFPMKSNPLVKGNSLLFPDKIPNVFKGLSTGTLPVCNSVILASNALSWFL